MLLFMISTFLVVVISMKHTVPGVSLGTEIFPGHPHGMAATRLSSSVLLVEDDRALSGMLHEILTAEGYRVDTAFDGQQGMHRGLTGNYDALIVDRGLSVMDGADLVALLRSRGVTTPALILTARGSVEDRVEGLDAGAQDYLVKPFDVLELLARVRALLRRTDGAITVLQAGGLRLDLLTRVVSGATPDGADVELSEREASLLATLMAAPTRIFSRARLLDTVFIGVDSDATIDLNVHYLRRKLGKAVIRTVHGAGYRFGLE